MQQHAAVVHSPRVLLLLLTRNLPPRVVSRQPSRDADTSWGASPMRLTRRNASSSHQKRRRKLSADPVERKRLHAPPRRVLRSPLALVPARAAPPQALRPFLPHPPLPLLTYSEALRDSAPSANSWLQHYRQIYLHLSSVKVTQQPGCLASRGHHLLQSPRRDQSPHRRPLPQSTPSRRSRRHLRNHPQPQQRRGGAERVAACRRAPRREGAARACVLQSNRARKTFRRVRASSAQCGGIGSALALPHQSWRRAP